ncbi:MAG: hypothetical protein LBT02_01360 [Rickettsiales bacterium]|jgi:hypothetical protein|nr:hypothetical protein [Rickettsiales bacterium]
MKIFFVICLFLSSFAFANSVCQLNNPDYFIDESFFGSNGYIVDFSVPEHAIYKVYKKNELDGFVLCSRQDFSNGEMEIVITYDVNKNVKNLYFQKLFFDGSEKFNNLTFTTQFMNYKDLSKISNISKEFPEIFNSIIKGVEKNVSIVENYNGN